ncbi:MAG: TetR/AcrR family transcriptional regulator [Burkholderiaceae bacterium]
MKLPPLPCLNAGLPAKRTRTRSALVDAALELIADQEPETISIDMLVRHAGMARGTFYNYFPCWQDLLVAVAEKLHGDFVERVESRFGPDDSDTVVLACMARWTIQLCIDDRRLAWAWVRMGPRLHDLLFERQAAQSRPKQAIRKLCDGHATDLGAFCLIGGTVFTTARQLLSGKLSIAEAEDVLALVLRGIGAPPAQIRPALDRAREFVHAQAGPVAQSPPSPGAV